MANIETLPKLFKVVDRLLGQNNTLKSFQGIINQYTGDDWKQFVKVDKEIYNRCTIKKNEEMELVVVTWGVGQDTPKHGHPTGGCVFKVLQGNFKEKFYKKMSDSKHVVNRRNQGDLGYIDNSLGFHIVENDSQKIAVSLHIYSPPFEKCCD